MKKILIITAAAAALSCNPPWPEEVQKEQKPIFLQEEADVFEEISEPLEWCFEEGHDEDYLRAEVAIFSLAANHSRTRNETQDNLRERANVVYEAALEVSEERGEYVDPVDLAIIWRFETGFRWRAVGDQGRSCGPTQIRTDYTDRPSCELLQTNPHLAFVWTAHKLLDIREREGSTEINRYNGGGRGAMMYGARHAAVKTLIERAIDGEEFDVEMYNFICEVLG